MIEFPPTACTTHRDALLDFVDGQDVGPATAAALDHLGRCRACEQELELTAVTIVAIRRMFQEAAFAEPSRDAWNRLRVRLDRPTRGARVARAARASRAPVAGAIIAASLAVVVGLFGVLPGGAPRATATPVASRVSIAVLRPAGSATDPTIIRLVAAAASRQDNRATDNGATDNRALGRKVAPDGDNSIARAEEVLPGDDARPGRPMAST
jgi:hypothetical protein